MEDPERHGQPVALRGHHHTGRQLQADVRAERKPYPGRGGRTLYD